MHRIAIGSDHAGLEIKNAVRDALIQDGHQVTDVGTETKDSVDYPDYAARVARGVAGGEFDCGVLVCWTGIGMSITANKVAGVRAGLCCTIDQARLTRQHNDANVLCLGQMNLDAGQAIEIAKTFLTTDFEGGRHERRVDKVRALESATPDQV